MSLRKVVKVKPITPDLVVRDPKTGNKLPPDGKRVQLTSFWIRRIKDGAVEVIESN